MVALSVRGSQSWEKIMEPLGIPRMARVSFLEDEIGTSENWLQSDNTAKLILNSRVLLYDGRGRRGGSLFSGPEDLGWSR